jgi:hypothetical protein
MPRDFPTGRVRRKSAFLRLNQAETGDLSRSFVVELVGCARNQAGLQPNVAVSGNIEGGKRFATGNKMQLVDFATDLPPARG